MNVTIVRRVGLAAALVLALVVPGRSQTLTPFKFQGVIHDNADALGANWVISGTWALELRGNSGKAKFAASLTMKQNGPVPGAPHTHHIFLKDVPVTVLANGYSVTGVATIAGNGGLGNNYTNSLVTVEVTGGADLPVSNVRVILHAPEATNHFGTDPLNGVVVYQP
jgi:hypothetical protein